VGGPGTVVRAAQSLPLASGREVLSWEELEQSQREPALTGLAHEACSAAQATRSASPCTATAFAYPPILPYLMGHGRRLTTRALLANRTSAIARPRHDSQAGNDRAPNCSRFRFYERLGRAASDLCVAPTGSDSNSGAERRAVSHDQQGGLGRDTWHDRARAAGQLPGPVITGASGTSTGRITNRPRCMAPKFTRRMAGPGTTAAAM
jgi:hypothetical protein